MNLCATAAASFLMLALFTPIAHAQTAAVVDPSPPWSFRGIISNYAPGKEARVQPTLIADRGALHLEGRYNYEDTKSGSGFVGWNHEVENTVSLALTPMLGAVAGNTAGVIPALELTLGVGFLELYSENEYVIDLNESSDSYFYNWSELGLSTAKWFRGGLVTQRSRTVQSSRDFQRGPFLGVTVGPVETAFYFFNPTSDDYYYVGSVAVSWTLR